MLKKCEKTEQQVFLLYPTCSLNHGGLSSVIMLIASPLILPGKRDTLHQPSNSAVLYPLHKIIKLLLCHSSGQTSQVRVFQRQFWSHPTNVEARNPYAAGNLTAVNRKLISFRHLYSGWEKRFGCPLPKATSRSSINTTRSVLSTVIFSLREAPLEMIL